MIRPLVACLALVLCTPARARPVLLELFTSQACSSCPPADALLGELQAASNAVLALSLHVTYWNGPGWSDPFSSSQATARQRAYAAALRTEVFTPQLIVDGRTSTVGSDQQAVADAIARARQDQAAGPPLTLGVTTSGLHATIGAGSGDATLLLVGYDPAHSTHIAGGENGGVDLHETNVVRSLRVVAHWTGGPVQRDLAVPPGEKTALILQAGDGTILATAVP